MCGRMPRFELPTLAATRAGQSLVVREVVRVLKTLQFCQQRPVVSQKKPKIQRALSIQCHDSLSLQNSSFAETVSCRRRKQGSNESPRWRCASIHPGSVFWRLEDRVQESRFVPRLKEIYHVGICILHPMVEDTALHLRLMNQRTVLVFPY